MHDIQDFGNQPESYNPMIDRAYQWVWNTLMPECKPGRRAKYTTSLRGVGPIPQV